MLFKDLTVNISGKKCFSVDCFVFVSNHLTEKLTLSNLMNKKDEKIIQTTFNEISIRVLIHLTVEPIHHRTFTSTLLAQRAAVLAILVFILA